MSTNFVYGSGNPLFKEPKKEPKKTTKTPTAGQAASARLQAEAADFAAGTGRYAQPLNPIYIPSTTPVTTSTQPVVTTTLTDEEIAANQRALLAQQEANQRAEELRRRGQSAYDLLLSEFNQYGLGTLVEPLKALIVSGPSEAELVLALRQTDAYQKRFAANKVRLANGFRALSEAEYIELEDKYQEIMQNYGLPATYYSKDATGRQEGFEKLMGGNVNPVTLEERIILGQKRVLDGPPEVTTALKQFFPNITNGDILAYVLDPTQALANIQKKVLAAEIGGAALSQGLGTSLQRAEELARFGVTGETARQGFQAVAEIAPRGSQLASIYRQEPYGQAEVETEVFGLTGSAEAAKRRRKLTELEQASFSGQAGATGGALGRERAGSF